jgi:uncharacterized protein (DUF342 family)
MYNAIFDMENGALVANTKSTAGRLQNLADEAYAKAEMYEKAADAAYALAEGEIKAESEKADAEKEILSTAVENTKNADNSIITMTEEKLGE